MRTKTLVAAAALMLLTSGADAQTTTSSRRCVGNTCTTTTDSGRDTSTMTCQHYAGGSSDCTTEHKEKAPRLPSVQTVTFDHAQESAKADARTRAGYRDPNARALACGAGYRMTERDGCQPRR
jgi:hypothetical protein